MTHSSVSQNYSGPRRKYSYNARCLALNKRMLIDRQPIRQIRFSHHCWARLPDCVLPFKYVVSWQKYSFSAINGSYAPGTLLSVDVILHQHPGQPYRFVFLSLRSEQCNFPQTLANFPQTCEQYILMPPAF